MRRVENTRRSAAEAMDFELPSGPRMAPSRVDTMLPRTHGRPSGKA